MGSLEVLADVLLEKTSRTEIASVAGWKQVARVRPSRLILAAVVCDLAVLLTTYIAVIVGLAADQEVPQMNQVAIWSLGLALVWLPFAAGQGAYHSAVMGDALRSPFVVAKTTILAGALFHLLPLVGGRVNSRIAGIGLVLVLVFVMVLWRLIWSRLAPVFTTPIDLVVVGTGWAGQVLLDALTIGPLWRMRIIAFVCDNPGLIGTRLGGVPVHSAGDLADIVHRNPLPTRVVLATEDDSHANLYEQLTSVALTGVEIVSMASVYEEATGRIPVRHLGNTWWARLPRPSTSILYRSAKRVIDIGGALFGLTVLCIVLPLVMYRLRAETRGSLFFTQTRVGRYGRPVKVIKLRTLPLVTSPYESNVWARKNGNRPEPMGAFLRATGMDELPQCLNILKGEMSLVGPRPYVPEEVEELQGHIPFFRSRAMVRPGLTGWAQVNWGYGHSLEDEVEKLQYDLFYVGHQSVYLDLLIVLRTVRILLRRSRPVGRPSLSTTQEQRGIV